MATAEKVPMLEEGHRKLSDELKRLRSEERPAIVEAIEEARAHGDLSENAEYHAAKERQGQIEATIADLEDRLSRAMVIDPTTLSGDKVVFGATVTLVDEDDKTVKYQLVGQTEADARVMVNGREVPLIASDGTFHYFTPPLPNGESVITVTAQNARGGVNTQQKTVVIQ